MSDKKTLERLIRRWYQRSKPDTLVNSNEFDNFISLWIAFNAWSIHATGIESNDRDMLESLKERPELTESFEKCKNDEYFMTQLLMMKDVEIPTHRNPPFVSFNNVNSFGDILEVIYRIRCNLFHGRKDPTETNELKLVRWACYILDNVFRRVMDSSYFLT